MVIAEALLTAEEFGSLPDNGQLTELVRGRVVPVNMPIPRHGQICITTGYLLRRYFEGNDLGHVVGNDSGVVTERNPDTVRGADIAFYSFQKVPKGRLPNKYLEVSPDVVFEIRSPGDRWAEIIAKVEEYLKAGVKAVCVLDDQTETLTIYRSNQQPQKLTADEEFALPDLLGEFRVFVRRFFE